MDANIHPDLQQLQSRYMQLVQSVNDGTMSPDDAMMTLAAMKVFDGAGAEWSYTPNGQLMRAGQPGEEPQPAEPWSFVAAQQPPRPEEAQWQAPFPSPAGQPGFPPQAGQPMGGGYAQPGQMGPGQMGPGQMGGGYAQPGQMGPGQMAQPMGGGYPAQAGRPLPGSAASRASSMPAWLERPAAIVRANLRTIIVAAVAIALVLVVVALRGGGEETSVDGVPVIPAEPALPQPQETPDQQPPAGPNEDEQPADPDTGSPEDGGDAEEAQTVPSASDVEEAVLALSSGEPEQAAARLRQELEPLELRLYAAQLRGLPTVGMDIVTELAEPAGEGRARQVWRLIDVRTEETLSIFEAAWVQNDEGVWQLETTPKVR